MTDRSEGISLIELVARFGGRLKGDGGVRVSQVATLESAGPGTLTFLANPKYASRLAKTRASAVIVPDTADTFCPCPAIITAEPYVYFAKVAQLLNPAKPLEAGVHPSAVVASQVPPGARIGPLVVVEEEVELGEGVILEAGAHIGRGAVIGAGSQIGPKVVIYPGMRVGERVRIAAGTVIGAEGFGFARETGGTWRRIPQIGRVVIGDEADIGANTTIDRGTLDDTVIGKGVILDNQIQIGHNVRIGDYSAIAGCVGIAGSTEIGKRCMIGGAAMIIGHLTIADDVTISSCTMVTKSITAAGTVTGTLPQQSHEEWLKNFSHLRHLSQMADKLRLLEERIASLENVS